MKTRSTADPIKRFLARHRVAAAHRLLLSAERLSGAIGRYQDKAYDRLVDLEQRLS